MVWGKLGQPLVWGGLLVLIGLILLADVVTTLPGQSSANWWITAFRSPQSIRSLATLGVMALGSAAILGMARWSVHRGATPSGHPDATGLQLDSPRGFRALAPLLGIALMVVGAAVGVGDWAASQRLMPPSRITVPPQQRIESYPAISATSSVKVMLPSRVFVRSVSVQDQTAALEFLRVGEESGQGQLQTLRAFDPVEVQGVRWSILGVEYSDAVLAAVVEPTKDGAIPAMGTVGDSLQFEIDGPTYKVTQVTRNYLGVLGPAVELENDEFGRFWVFQRAAASDGERTPTFDHGLKLSRLERAPVAVLAVSEAPAQDLLPVAGILFVVGLALFLLLPDIVVRSREGETLVWSVNEASALEDTDE